MKRSIWLRRARQMIVIMGSFARLGEQITHRRATAPTRATGNFSRRSVWWSIQPAQILTRSICFGLSWRRSRALSSNKQTKVLNQVMTNNLEAYRTTPWASKKAQAVQTPEAIDLLKKAIALDPELRSAYARIGYATE